MRSWPPRAARASSYTAFRTCAGLPGFDIADRIETFYEGDGGIEAVIEAHGGYIRQETLSDAVVSGEPPSGAYTESHNLDGAEVTIGVRKT